jgi:hypothetical protein
MGRGAVSAMQLLRGRGDCWTRGRTGFCNARDREKGSEVGRSGLQACKSLFRILPTFFFARNTPN